MSISKEVLQNHLTAVISKQERVVLLNMSAEGPAIGVGKNISPRRVNKQIPF